MAKGKSSVFVRPIIFDKSKKDAVLIVNDMSGDLYAQTSGQMYERGYRVIVLNPHDLAHSHRYNPFLDIDGENETVHMAQMFVQAVSGGDGTSKDSVWTAGAERFVTFFLKCLRKKGMPYNNPHNLFYLFQSFGNDGSKLHRFVADTSLQFVADLIRGRENARQPSYEKRQLGKQERSGEKPMKSEERQLFSELLQRHDGEPLTLYWKRRKAHLASSDKSALVGQFRQLRAGRKRAEDAGSKVAADMKKRQLEAEFRKITQPGQKSAQEMKAQ